MCKQKLISNKFDFELTTTVSSYWWSAIWRTPLRDQVWLKEVNKKFHGLTHIKLLRRYLLKTWRSAKYKENGELQEPKIVFLL